MKAKKRRVKSKPAGKRGVKDLPVSDAKAKNAKGGIMNPMSPPVTAMKYGPAVIAQDLKQSLK